MVWYESELTLRTIPTYDCMCFGENFRGHEVSDSLSILHNIVE